MRIGVVGINHKLADLKLREQLARASLKHFRGEQSLQNPHFFVQLSTCNRTEIYFQSDDLTETHTYILACLRESADRDFDQKLYSYFGQDCLLHLSRVAAGLDSAIVAETEIQGQVRDAYQLASEDAHLPEELHYLFQKALKIGKEVRSQLPIQRGLPDLEHAILQVTKDAFSSRLPRSTLFVGASAINRKILSFLKKKQCSNITLCNRTSSSAQKTAQDFACAVLPWKELEAKWRDFELVICGTKAQEPIIFDSFPSEKTHNQLIVFDLGVPRNVQIEPALNPNITVLNIDHMLEMLSSRKTQIQHILVQAERLVEIAAEKYIERFQLRKKQRELWLDAI